MKKDERKEGPSETERRPTQGRVDYQIFSKTSFILNSVLCMVAVGDRIIWLSAGVLRGQKSVGSPGAGIGVCELLDWVMGKEFKLVSSGSTEVLLITKTSLWPLDPQILKPLNTSLCSLLYNLGNHSPER